MKTPLLPFTALSSLALLAGSLLNLQAAETVWLHSLDLSQMRQGYGRPQVNRSMREQPLSIDGQKFEHGVGTHANSTLWLDLAGGTERFQATVGLDDAAGKGSVTFTILGDGKKLFDSGTMKSGQPGKPVDLDLKGVRTLLLRVGDAGDGITFDHADWAEARFLVSGAKPATMRAPMPVEAKVILTPKPPSTPRINGPAVYGCRPGNPFLYRIPATGQRPMQFAVENLPAGLQLDPATGIITGTVPARGEYNTTLRAANSQGKAQKSFKIVSGDTLSLTPSMGWNHWYAHYNRITDRMMREAADLMIRSGMADAGYQYVNIDDCWMNAEKHRDPMRVGPLRDDKGNLLPNKHFPDMKGLTDYIHAKGLKAGIYTSPGPKTCGGFAGSWQHEVQDAKQFADWGFDFLKYDYCSYRGVVSKPPSLEEMKGPYKLMGELLKQQPRDMLFNLCQYGMGKVWEWGAQVGGQSWRTAGDLGLELDRIFAIALKNAEYRAWQKPGAWNDPDYLQIGYIGNAFGYVGTAPGGGLPEPCPLTPNEQYAFMSLWCLMASPLFYSGDMTHLDEFTLNILCNPEVIDVNQDPLGQCARVVKLDEDSFLMVKDMEDGSKALGLVNAGEAPVTIKATWSDLGVAGKQRVRDLWRQKDLGNFTGQFQAEAGRHAVVLVRLWPAP